MKHNSGIGFLLISKIILPSENYKPYQGDPMHPLLIRQKTLPLLILFITLIVPVGAFTQTNAINTAATDSMTEK